MASVDSRPRASAAARPETPTGRAAPRVKTRYDELFTRLHASGEGAFIPFAVLGDPTPDATHGVLDALVAGGADALELGIPFSDPIADGPTIQDATRRALAAGTTPETCWEILAAFRARHPEIPVGLLVYANLVVHAGPERFYRAAAAAGVDSVLVADVPVMEAEPFVAAARAAGVAPVLLAPLDLPAARVAQVAALCDGYTYVLTRSGTTGVQERLRFAHGALIDALRAAGAPPPVFGFGISTPEHVRAALAAGAAGAISGSAVVARIAAHGVDAAGLEAVRVFVHQLKAATRAG